MIIDELILLVKCLAWIGVIAIAIFILLGPLIEMLFDMFMADVFMEEDEADDE